MPRRQYSYGRDNLNVPRPKERTVTLEELQARIYAAGQVGKSTPFYNPSGRPFEPSLGTDPSNAPFQPPGLEDEP